MQKNLDEGQRQEKLGKLDLLDQQFVGYFEDLEPDQFSKAEYRAQAIEARSLCVEARELINTVKAELNQ